MKMPNFPPLPDFPRPNLSPKTKTDNCCSRTERCCWTIATWLPISIVYGATLWAVYVGAYLIAVSFIKGLLGTYPLVVKLRVCLGWFIAWLVVGLYGLCIWSYSVAVFTDPGSPIDAVPPPKPPVSALNPLCLLFVLQ